MTEQWLCVDCQFILAYVSDKSVVRIKRKDLYVEVEGGKVTVTCCRCGKRNTMTDDKVKSERKEE